MAKSRPRGGRRYYTKEWARDEGTCQYCGFPGECIDHVLPWSYVPDDSPENVVVSCVRCNQIAKEIVFPSFEAKKDYILKIRRAELQRKFEDDQEYFG